MKPVRVITDEELAYADLSLRISWRTDQISALEAELAPIQRAFESFEWEYTQRLGHLHAELQTTSAMTQRIAEQTTRIHARLVADPGGVLGDIFDRDELREIGDMFGIEVPDDWFAEAREAPRQGGEDWSWAGDAFGSEEEIIREMQRSRKRRMPKDDITDMKKLYRDLARRYHPDLAGNDDEQSLRQEIMLRVNHAWQCQDLDALHEIDQELERMLPGWSASHLAHRLSWARRECERLDTNAGTLIRRIRQLRASETFPLWFNSSLGKTVISRRASALARDIEREQQRLEDTKLAFKQALAHYAAAVA